MVKNRSQLLYHKKNNCIFRQPQAHPRDHVEIEKSKFICNFENCHKEFDTKRQFTRHKKRHLMLYNCNICNQKLSSNWELKIHKRRHNGNKCETCPFCDQSFFDSSSKQKHIQSFHSGDSKQFRCRLCKKKFARFVFCVTIIVFDNDFNGFFLFCFVLFYFDALGDCYTEKRHYRGILGHTWIRQVVQYGNVRYVKKMVKQSV